MVGAHVNPTRDIDRAAFRQGPQGDQSGFSWRVDPGRTAVEPQRHRRRAGGRHQQQRCQRHRQRVGGQKLSDGLLLHVGFMVGQNLGAARHRGDQFLAARADPPKPAPLRQRPGLCVHAQRLGHQVDDGAHFPYRRRAHLPRRRASPRAADRRSSHRRFVGAKLSGPRAGRQPADRNRLSPGHMSSRATSFCWRPTASTSMSAAASSSTRSTAARTTWTTPPRRSSKRPTPRQPRQSDRADRADRRAARRR